MLNIKSFAELTNVELYQIIMLREQVFVVEQNCPYLDCDGKDLTSMHLWLSKDGVCAAYSRIVPPQYEKDLWSIGRVVVHPDFRGTGLGKEIMQAAIGYLKLHKASNEIQISAQVYLLRFYNELGFHEVGSTYLEDDIPHIKMIWSEKLV